eukprot:scaffold64995_cov41-Attheya_sp.AAC.1
MTRVQSDFFIDTQMSVVSSNGTVVIVDFVSCHRRGSSISEEAVADQRRVLIYALYIRALYELVGPREERSAQSKIWLRDLLRSSRREIGRAIHFHAKIHAVIFHSLLILCPLGRNERAMASSTGATPPLQLFDWFVDVPHPAASPSCPTHFSLKPSSNTGVADELENEVGFSRLSRFCFPEHEDRSYAQEVQRRGALPESSLKLNRFDMRSEHFVGGYAQHFVVCLQLKSGDRVYGHVRRYLPALTCRFDAGRRGIRAMLCLTRIPGGESLYASMLKSIDVISSQQTATPSKLHPTASPQQAFLHALAAEHIRLQKSLAGGDLGKPEMMILSKIEFGFSVTASVDAMRFLAPHTILQASASASSSSGWLIMPLLRCIGVSHSMRFLSALLCERRVILLSKSPCRLSACGMAAIQMLRQGLLEWQHVYIPILPPHLLQYLGAPMPYLVGLLTHHAPLLEQVPDIGEVLILNLDTNSMETRNLPPHEVSSKIPDLLRGSLNDGSNPQQCTYPTVSVSEILASDLTEVIRIDRKFLSASDQVLHEKLGNTAAKASGAIKGGLRKLKKRTKQYVQKQSSYGGSDLEEEEGTREPGVENTIVVGMEDYSYNEGYSHEAAEQEARFAFTIFFFSIFGDMRWYLTKSAKGVELDKSKFMESRRQMGDGQGTPMFPLLSYFVQSQLFDEFAKARVEELIAHVPAGMADPLFLHLMHLHRTQKLDFNPQSVKGNARQLFNTIGSAKFVIQWSTNIRSRAMALTSNTAYQGNDMDAVAKLTEDCREVSTFLVDVMAVIWSRIRDSRGMQWKHALLALNLLRNLLLHGPLVVVTEATDGLDKIRALKTFSDTMRSQNAALVRSAAIQVYELVVDRAKLFSQRRACAERRYLIKNPLPHRSRDPRIKLSLTFQNMHMLVRPSASVKPSESGAPPPMRPIHQPVHQPVRRPIQQVTRPVPPTGPRPTAQAPPPPVAATSNYAQDLLSFDFGSPAPAAPVTSAQPDPFGMQNLAANVPSAAPTGPTSPISGLGSASVDSARSSVPPATGPTQRPVPSTGFQQHQAPPQSYQSQTQQFPPNNGMYPPGPATGPAPPVPNAGFPQQPALPTKPPQSYPPQPQQFPPNNAMPGPSPAPYSPAGVPPTQQPQPSAQYPQMQPPQATMPYGATPQHQTTPTYGALPSQTAPVSPQRQQQQQPFAQSPVVGGQVQPPSGAGRMPYPQQGYAPYPQQPQAQQGPYPGAPNQYGQPGPHQQQQHPQQINQQPGQPSPPHRPTQPSLSIFDPMAAAKRDPFA